MSIASHRSLVDCLYPTFETSAFKIYRSKFGTKGFQGSNLERLSVGYFHEMNCSKDSRTEKLSNMVSLLDGSQDADFVTKCKQVDDRLTGADTDELDAYDRVAEDKPPPAA
jgi:hypothetical protein